jgi:hypothetical protein
MSDYPGRIRHTAAEMLGSNKIRKVLGLLSPISLI